MSGETITDNWTLWACPESADYDALSDAKYDTSVEGNPNRHLQLRLRAMPTLFKSKLEDYNDLVSCTDFTFYMSNQCIVYELQTSQLSFSHYLHWHSEKTIDVSTAVTTECDGELSEGDFVYEWTWSVDDFKDSDGNLDDDGQAYYIDLGDSATDHVNAICADIERPTSFSGLEKEFEQIIKVSVTALKNPPNEPLVEGDSVDADLYRKFEVSDLCIDLTITDPCNLAEYETFQWSDEDGTAAQVTLVTEDSVTWN